MTRPSTIAVTGGTGFVGRTLVRELLARGYKVRALARDRAKAAEALPAPGTNSGLELIYGDVLDSAACARLVSGTQAAIHLVGIIRETPGQTFQRLHVDAAARVLEACGGAGVRRYVHMCALGATPTGKTAYQRTKAEGERLVRRSGLDWTIFRPGLIHGPGGEFTEMAAEWVSGHAPPYLFAPYFTRWQIDTSVPLGTAKPVDPRIAPVAVEDVARAFAAALEKPQSVGEIYNLVGGQTLSWPEMLVHFRDHVPSANERLKPVGVPSEVAGAIAKAAKAVGLGGLLPFDEGMAYLGGQDAVASLDKARAHLGWEPRRFDESFAEYAGQL